MKKILTILFGLSFCWILPIGASVSPPTPVPLLCYYLDAQSMTAGSVVTMIGGIPNVSIRIFNYGMNVSEGIFTFYDSTGTVIASGQSGGGGGYIDLPLGADLLVSCSNDCTMTIYIVAVQS